MSFPKYLAQANQLIAALPAGPQAVFVDCCELIDMQRQDVLVQTGQYAEHAYFPINSFVANMFNLADGECLQVGLTGNEGMTSYEIALGRWVATLTIVVQGAGRAFRIHHRDLQKLISMNPALKDVIYKYIASQLDQLARNMACVSSHRVEQRLARWLLVVNDCLHSSELPLTQEMLASMLGVRREQVTSVASLLQKNGFISYSRGNVTLLNVSGLRAIACGCYQSSLQASHSSPEKADQQLFSY